ncbi:hypothetical protein ACHWQZ_G011489 [Mnemiopsis leidyi]
MLSRCCKVKKTSFTERIILPNCSFPFSWIIYLHLQQIADIKRLTVSSEKKRSLSNFEFFRGVLEFQSDDYVFCLLDDCFKIAAYRSSLIMPMVVWPMTAFDRNIAFNCINYLSLHDKFLAYMLSKCSTPEDFAIIKEIVSNQVHSGNVCDYSMAEDHELIQKVSTHELMKFICYHFVFKFTAKAILLKQMHCNDLKFWANRESSLISLGCKSNFSIPTCCILNKHMDQVLEEPFPLYSVLSDNRQTGLLLQKFLGALFSFYESSSYSDKEFAAACNKGLLSVKGEETSHKEISRDILLASHELSTIYLLDTFLPKNLNQVELLTLNKKLVYCLSCVKTCDGSDIFTTIILKIVCKRLIENSPKELLELITSGSGMDVVCASSDLFIKLLCVKSLVSEFGLQILEELRLKAEWLVEIDSELRQTVDYFNILGQNYRTTRCAVLGSHSTFAFEPMNVMLSYFQSKRSKITDDEHFLYLDCIKNTLEFDQLKTLQKLDSGVLFGIPLSDWKGNRDLVFLTYSYLTQSNSSCALTKFLEYIFHFPIRSDSMFLATMREDVVSKFRETLGEKFAAQGHQLYTWYKCAGGHVYAINNCGEPQEKGKCFCGGEIGGMKHTLSKGNQRLETYKFSEKGYNLPPIGFLSSVDSERNLKSLSLSFLRWLIHASYVVSPKITSCGKVFGLDDKDNVASYLKQRLENDLTGIQTTLGKNPEDTQIWMVTAIKHMFLHTDSFNHDYSVRDGRNQLEDVYLRMITPIIERADELISHGKELVHGSNDEYIRQVLGLSYPENGPGLLDCPEFLRKSTPVFEKLKREFRKSGNVKNHPTVNKFITNRSSLDILYLLPDLIKALFSILRKVNFRITNHEANKFIIKDFLGSSEVKLWNDLWLKAKSIASIVDNIYLPEEYSDRILTLESKLTDLIPSKEGPGICSWLLINNLIPFYNQFAQGPVINILSLTDFVTPAPVPNYDLVALMYDAYDGFLFNFNLLEDCLLTMFCVHSRCRIDTKSVAQLLFRPLKCEDTWYKILKQMPKGSPETNEGLVASPETLRSLEIVIQMSAEYNTLSVDEISDVCQLNLPSLKKESLHSQWHHIWFLLSVSNGRFYMPPESQKRAEEFLKTQAPSELALVALNVLQADKFVKILHMMIVEWVVNNPSFDCQGMFLTEALDFFCEQAGIPELGKILELDSNDLKVEDSISCFDFLLSKNIIL